MTRAAADPPVHLDRTSALPLTAQVFTQLREAMYGGILAPGERLPSSRALAARLRVSRSVVTEAYQQLYAEGWLDGHHGSGTFVTQHEALPAAPDPPRSPAPPPARETPRWSRAQARQRRMIDLRPGAPWVRGFDRAAWRRAWRHAAEHPPDDDPDPRGLPRLRALLAEHLRRARSVRVGPENIIVTRGTGNGVDLVAALLGPDLRAGLEEPGYQKARSILAARGAQVIPCPVDRDGIDVDALPRDLSLVYTTPAHQYPIGARLPVRRRERLLAWARETGAVVVEDDYDAEFRYDVSPLPALYGLDPGRVVLLGTLSKTLSPDLGIGWLVAEPALVERLAELRYRLSDRTSVPVQAATALLLERGDLDRHLRRMRLEYARRRALLIGRFGSRLLGDTAGLHVMLPLPAGAVTPVVEEAAGHGVLVSDTVHTSHGAPAVHGLVIGYGSVERTDLDRACTVLEHALNRHAPQAATRPEPKKGEA